LRTYWDAAEQHWQIFIDDPEDGALCEFEFPDAAFGWLRHPDVFLREMAGVEGLWRPFFERVRGFVESGHVHVVCRAEAEDVTGGKPRVLRPGFHHHGVVGPDWIDHDTFMRSDVPPVCVSLEHHRDEPPSWEAFPDVSPAFRAACEQLQGVAISMLHSLMKPVIRRASVWPAPEYFKTRRTGETTLPDEVRGVHGALWWLQRNYCGVDTLLLEPGILVLADVHGRVKICRDVSPEHWLAGELEGGTRLQPSRAE
jgi:hypothetical protein